MENLRPSGLLCRADLRVEMRLPDEEEKLMIPFGLILFAVLRLVNRQPRHDLAWPTSWSREE